MTHLLAPLAASSNKAHDYLFAKMVADIENVGYSINPDALPTDLTQQLYLHLEQMDPEKFDRAGIGREQQQMFNRFVRSSEVCWITGSSAAGREWLQWAEELKLYLNRHLFLGLFSFESHFAHYRAGDFYKRHLDAFQGETNRILSLVVYLNPHWALEDGGELVIYRSEEDQEGIKVTPTFGTVVLFLSEVFPHEVLPARRDRYSIAGWFRVNSSTAKRADPPS